MLIVHRLSSNLKTNRITTKLSHDGSRDAEPYSRTRAREYSYLQGHAIISEQFFLGYVGLDRLNNASRDEDNIIDQIYVKQRCIILCVGLYRAAPVRGGVGDQGAQQAEGRQLQAQHQAAVQQLVRQGQRLVQKDPEGPGED